MCLQIGCAGGELNRESSALATCPPPMLETARLCSLVADAILQPSPWMQTTAGRGGESPPSGQWLVGAARKTVPSPGCCTDKKRSPSRSKPIPVSSESCGPDAICSGLPLSLPISGTTSRRTNGGHRFIAHELVEVTSLLVATHVKTSLLFLPTVTAALSCSNRPSAVCFRGGSWP